MTCPRPQRRRICRVRSLFTKQERTLKYIMKEAGTRKKLLFHHDKRYIPFLLTEFQVRTVSHEPSFFPLFHRFMAEARRARAIKSRGKRGSLTYSTDREDEVGKIFIFLYCVSDGFRNDSINEKGLKFLRQVESKTSQFDIVFKLLASFSTQFRVKESFKLLLPIQLKEIWLPIRINFL